MSKKTVVTVGIVLACVVLAIGVFFLFNPVQPANAITERQAIDAVTAAHPQLASYETTTLPPSSVETKQAADGWYLGFIQHGSGVPGVLNAQCYYVSNGRDVSTTGMYVREEGVNAEDVVLETCAPVAATQPAVVPFGNVTLALGETAAFQGISIEPLSIQEDSRCPVDVQCIQAGTVRVNMQIVSDTATSTDVVKLGEPFTSQGYVITLAATTPDKHSKIQIQPADYALTFSVGPQNAPATAKCYIGGCSAQLCTDAPGAISNCIYNSAFACYKAATCERQGNGECGWTETSALQACLKENASGAI